MKESHLRSILKALTWRLIAAGTIFVISYTVTGKTTLALEIVGIEFFIKMFLYYLHERAWQSISIGTVRKLYKKK